MSINVMNWVWEHSQARGNCRWVLLAIADCADENGMNAFPSKQKLAAKTLLGESTIRRAVKRLEEAGCISVDRSTTRGRANVYTVHMHAGGLPVDDPVDNDEDTGSERRGVKVAPRQERRSGGSTRPRSGVTGAPLPSGTINEPSAGRPGLDGKGADEDDSEIDPVADAVLTRLGSAWHLSDSDRRRLAPLIVGKVIEGWPVNGLTHYLSANPSGVVSPVAVLTSRLQGLPAPERGGRVPAPRPEWCGECDQSTRQILLNDEGRAMRCPRCHPLRDAPL